MNVKVLSLSTLLILSSLSFNAHSMADNNADQSCEITINMNTEVLRPQEKIADAVADFVIEYPQKVYKNLKKAPFWSACAILVLCGAYQRGGFDIFDLLAAGYIIKNVL